MTITLTDVADIASEFSSTDPTFSARVDRLIALAYLEIPSTVFGQWQDAACAYLVAHWLKLDALRGAGGVTSESVGDLSRAYASLANTAGGGADDLELTAYGRSYKRLRRMQVRGPVVL